jgi:hypothetical protein
MDTTEERIERLMSEIEEMREGIILGMSLEALECMHLEPDFLKYLWDLIELECEAEAEVAVADANLRTAQDNMVEATSRRDQIVELCQHFERSNLHSMDYVDAVDLLCRAESPDADDVPDERLESGDESEGGEGSESRKHQKRSERSRRGKGSRKRRPRSREWIARSGMTPRKVRMKHYSLLLFIDVVCGMRSVQGAPNSVYRATGEDSMRRLPPGAHEVQSAAAKPDAPSAKKRLLAWCRPWRNWAWLVPKCIGLRPKCLRAVVKSTLAPARSFRTKSPSSRRCDADW